MRPRVIVLEVAEDRDRAKLLELGGVVGIADQPARVVPARGQEPEEVERDLTVAAGDEDVHGLRGYPTGAVAHAS